MTLHNGGRGRQVVDGESGPNLTALNRQWGGKASIDAPVRTVRIRLLGTVDLLVDGVHAEISGFRRKAVLAALAINSGKVVSSDLLIDVVWAGNSPATVNNTLQSHVSYLRRLLRIPGGIVSAVPGYRLDLGEDSTDVQVAERLLAEADATADPAIAGERLRAALELWRSRPLADVRGHPWFEQHADRFERTRQVALKSLTNARLVLGEHAELIPLLEDLTDEHPYDEELSGQLMLALYRAGRQADALTVFRRVRTRLGEELGIDPARSLRDLEAAILRQDPALDSTASPGRISLSDARIERARLPSVASVVVGRSEELGFINAVRDSAGAEATTSAVAITGMAGVGKSTLALRWAHDASAGFPDGQLYLDLQGFSSVTMPLGSEEALRKLVSALGTAPDLQPADPSALDNLYRTLLAGRRVLIVLDNAGSAEQVRPLLPSSPGCMAVITSRVDLSPLAVTNSAHQLRLKPLSAMHGRELFRSRLGMNLAADGGADLQEDILRLCAGLPLALAIAASRWPNLPFGWFGKPCLLSGADVLDALSGGDVTTDLRAVFSASYKALSESAAALFRQLATGHQNGSVVFADPSRKTEFGELVRANLIEVDERGWLTIHPLLRRYGEEMAAEAEKRAEGSRAGERGYLDGCQLPEWTWLTGQERRSDNSS
ncbi:AfsR/SARP family transcriptional regulator [Kribbella deserti]|uniref:BTAD domain-containing putative transcriptional regulator n=1 Tax=Kribbella deserti TaxID=1926257 RepID=A0ABV6QN15_9ACTN